MDLLQLGEQARKTGLKPRPNIAKDKYNMEDVDEFFEDTTWTEYKRSVDIPDASTEQSKDSIRLDIPTSRKTLGVGRIRSTKSSGTKRTNSRQDGETYSVNDVPDYPDFGMNDFDYSDHENQDIDMENKEDEDQGENQNPNQTQGGQDNVRIHQIILDPNDNPIDDTHTPEAHPGDILQDLNNEMTLSPIPILSLMKSTGSRQNSSHPSPQRSPSKAAKINASHFTRTMALAKKNIQKRPRIMASDNEESDGPGDNPSSDGFDTFDSDFIESRASHTSSYKPSQGEILVQPSPLPSPPPEGLRRSKRTRIAPLAYWRNERIVYTRASEANNGDPDSTLISDIRKVPLQEIREVVHIPEAMKVKPAARRGRPPKNATRGKKTKPKPQVYDYESDPQIAGSEWFKDKSLEAEVFESEDSRVKKVVAWSPDGGSFQSPPAGKNGQLGMENFKVAPLFDSESNTIAAGLLDFPVDGFKSLRTTGESLFIFHVVQGLVEVTLNSNKFVVTRGCSFEVPKLNIYSFKNIGQSSARLFFVQCHIA